MPRRTVDFGIYLGNTHASVALVEGKDVHVVKKTHNEERTPSAVYLDGRGRRS